MNKNSDFDIFRTAMGALGLFAALSLPAWAGVDSITISGDSKVSEMDAFTSIIVTVAEFTEDYLAPVGAIIVLVIAFWQLFFKRDFMSFALGLFTAIGLGGLSFFMTSIIDAFAS